MYQAGKDGDYSWLVEQSVSSNELNISYQIKHFHEIVAQGRSDKPFSDVVKLVEQHMRNLIEPKNATDIDSHFNGLRDNIEFTTKYILNALHISEKLTDSKFKTEKENKLNVVSDELMKLCKYLRDEI